MRRWLAAMVVVLVLVVPVLAEDRGKWVLWSSFDPVTTKDPTEIAILTKWRAISTHDDKESCEALATKMLRS